MRKYENVNAKKAEQLGMNPSSASQRLVRDLLFNFVKESGAVCYHCGECLTRETFSVEHKVPWLDSEEPLAMFFDLNNIAYSHLSCNSKAARKPNRAYASVKERNAAKHKRRYSPEWRSDRYQRLGT